ncbi:MAG: nuclear transport factor 2 family protein [Phycisphaerae bacterium]|jgi:hypothetical protein
MDWLTWVLFENLAALAAVLGTALFILLVYWRRTGRPLPLLIGLAVAMAALAVQTLVVTRREQAGQVLAGIADDVRAARTDALAAALAPEFLAGEMTPEEFVEYVGRQYDKVRVREVVCSSLTIKESAEDRFVAAAAYQGDITADDYRGWIRTRWEITFVRTDTGWQIAQILPTYIDGVPNANWRAIDAHP